MRRVPLYVVFVSFILSSYVLSKSKRPDLPEKYQPLPIVRQETSYSCGPASLLSILKYWDVFHGSESDLYVPLKTNKQSGTNPRNILKHARELGLIAAMKENVNYDMLRDAFRNGETVILDIQAWRENHTIPWKDDWEDGHYIVGIGIDHENLYAMDPSTDDHYAYIPLKELNDRWHDYENEDGKIWRNYQLGIFIKGKIPGPLFPVPQKVLYIE